MLEEDDVPVPFAEVDVTFVGVTTITFEDSVVLEVDVLELLTRTGPLTPVVFAVVAFVVEVEPFTTVTGPRAPEVPTVSAACEYFGAKRIKLTAHTKDFWNVRDLLIDTGSLNLE